MNFSNIIKLDARVFSFDVFDTVVTRKTATPTGIFLLMQGRLNKNHVPFPTQLVLDFSVFRMQAEEAARRISGNEEITLSEIYDVLSKQFCLSQNSRKFLINMELDEETNASIAIPQILQLISTLRNRGRRIVFASDTYLSKYQIQKLLENAGAFKTGDNIYVSSEFLATKASGNLFRKMLILEQCQPSYLVHIGDNLQSDVLAARRVGLQAFHFKTTQLTRYEAAFLKGVTDVPSREYLWQYFAGAARNARLSSKKTNPVQHELSCIGANVAGPVFLSYALWVLKKAEERKMARLYFISRDGQILLNLCRKIAERLDLKIDMRYIYGSRQAWFLPAITELKSRELNMLLQADPVLSIRVLSNRMGIDPDLVRKEINSFYGKTWRIDDNLSNFNIEQLRYVLLRSKLREMLLMNAEEVRKDALDYFHQEGLFDNMSWGIVDLGWQGRLQDSLQKILRIAGRDQTLCGFYFGLFPQNSRLSVNNEKLVFISSSKLLNTVLYNYTGLLELFAAADHGTTLRYHKDCETWYPVLKQQVNEQALSWGLTSLREGVFKLLDELPTDLLRELYLDLSTYRSRIALCMKLLKFNPSFEEAEAIGNFVFSSDQAETYMKAFAPPASFSQALYYILNSLRADYRKKTDLTNWAEATCVRSSSLPKFLLSYYIFNVPKLNKALETASIMKHKLSNIKAKHAKR